MHARSTPSLDQVAEDDKEVEIIDVNNLTDGLVPGQSPTIAVILLFFRGASAITIRLTTSTF